MRNDRAHALLSFLNHCSLQFDILRPLSRVLSFFPIFFQSQRLMDILRCNAEFFARKSLLPEFVSWLQSTTRFQTFQLFDFNHSPPPPSPWWQSDQNPKDIGVVLTKKCRNPNGVAVKARTRDQFYQHSNRTVSQFIWGPRKAQPQKQLLVEKRLIENYSSISRKWQ